MWSWRSLSTVLPLLASCTCGNRALVADADPRHVVVISLDTTRADVLGAYGDPSARTPRLDALAAEGVIFERHVSAAPTTLASHTSLMTGRYPLHHGVPRNGYHVDDRNDMLAEVLADAGFTTAAFLGAFPLTDHSNFLQGFGYADEQFDTPRSEVHEQAERRAGEVTDAALRWTAGRADERLFVFVHYFDVHAPYEPPPPFGSRVPVVAPDQGSLEHVARTRELLAKGGGRAHDVVLEALYRAELEYVDQEVGRLLDGLRAQGVLDDALVVLTADHGETFGTHVDELWDHGATVYDETVRTPLLLRFPGAEHAGTRIDDVVSNVDVFPTLLDLLSIPAGGIDGRSLVPLVEGGELPERPVFAEATKPWHPRNPDAEWANDWARKMVQVGSEKLHLDPQTGRTWLFDVGRDPRERLDLRGRRVERAAELEPMLQAWRDAADPLPSEKVSSPSITSLLEALGYVEE